MIHYYIIIRNRNFQLNWTDPGPECSLINTYSPWLSIIFQWISVFATHPAVIIKYGFFFRSCAKYYYRQHLPILFQPTIHLLLFNIYRAILIFRYSCNIYKYKRVWRSREQSSVFLSRYFTFFFLARYKRHCDIATFSLNIIKISR